MTVSIIISIIAVGFLAGILSGLMGVGGGTITIPAMVFLLGLSQQAAQGISLAVIVPTAFMGAYGYSLKKSIEPGTAFLMASGAIAGTAVASLLACNMPSEDLKKIFGAFAIIVAVKILKDVLSKQG